MDKIVDGFVNKIGSLIQYNTKVSGHRDQRRRRHVVTEHEGARNTINADYCISNIPLPMLKKIANNFEAGIRRRREACKYDPTCKLGWQANQPLLGIRQNQIYGGISYTDDPITQMWYPSYDYFTKNGTLTGVYNYDDNAIAFGNMGPEDADHDARQGAIKFHPEFADERLVPSDKAISIAWQNIPNEGGGWANWDPNSGMMRKLIRACWLRIVASSGGRSGFATARLAGGSHDVCATRGRTDRRQATAYRAEIKRAPNTRRLIQGRKLRPVNKNRQVLRSEEPIVSSSARKLSRACSCLTAQWCDVSMTAEQTW